MHKIKILLATYNGEKYIRDQIKSILSQKDVDLTVKVSDDNSGDNTTQVIMSEFPSVEIKTNKPGSGSAAKNFVKMITDLEFDEGFQYVAFSDQDDIWLSQKMISAVNLIVMHNSSLYCSNLTKWDTTNNTYSMLKKDHTQQKFDFLFEGGSAGCTYVFTTAFAKKLQLFFATIETNDWQGLSHDWLVYFFARTNGYKVTIDGNSYIKYRLHNENVHGHLNKLSFSTIREKSKQVFEGYYQNQIKNYINYLNPKSEEHKIYQHFLGGYVKRNFMIFRYNTQLIRDKKKFVIFAVLNILKF